MCGRKDNSSNYHKEKKVEHRLNGTVGGEKQYRGFDHSVLLWGYSIEKKGPF